ncbi:MAG: hypothetical protein Q4C97_04005 [Bacillota bacterium]|nr:hypothetical protein [Bacillota bacterium]
MANYENIKDANSKRTPSERREIARIAGKASGKARRRKANMRETANRLLTMVGEVEGLSDILRADGGESTYEEIITMAMIKKAAMGDVKAYEALKSTVGQTDKSDADLEEQRIRTDRAKRARDQEVGDTDAGDENIQSFLKALNPSEEELQNLFAEEDEEQENGEEKEETGGI